MGFKSVEEFLLETSSDKGGSWKELPVSGGLEDALPPEAGGAKGSRCPVSYAGEPLNEAVAVRGWKVALRELSGGLKTRFQLLRKLEREGFAREVAEDVLDRCEELKLVDDREYALQWAKTRSERKGLGKSILRRELEKKGVEQPYIDEALERCGIGDEDIARYLVDKKLASVTGPLDFKTREKYKRQLFGLLSRKGIDSGISIKVINQKIASLG